MDGESTGVWWPWKTPCLAVQPFVPAADLRGFVHASRSLGQEDRWWREVAVRNRKPTVGRGCGRRWSRQTENLLAPKGLTEREHPKQVPE